MRADERALPVDNWVHYLRLRDLREILSLTPEAVRGPVLELGCGDGVWTEELRARFENVVPIDVAPRARVPGTVLATAEKLPFGSGTFRLVVSSNVLEHVGDISSCLRELGRVTTSDGVMVHTMPTVWWKALQFATHPANSGIRLFRSRMRIGDTESRATGYDALPFNIEPAGDSGVRFPIYARARGAIWPSVHGVAQDHVSEFCRFRTASWNKIFDKHGLRLIRASPMFLHSPYRMLPYKGMWLRDRISRAGFASVYAYWLAKR